MYIINTLLDISTLEQKAVIGIELSKYLKNNIKTIYSNTSTEKTLEKFALDSIGKIVLLEPKDNLHELSELNLHYTNGLLGTVPEYVDEKTLDGKQYYCFVVLCNDEYGYSMIAPKNSYDDAIEAWFKRGVSNAETH